jgi:tRNA 2-selenouridine synthase
MEHISSKKVFFLMDFPLSCTCLLLCGKTGSGKSKLLQQLELSGYPCINLERIASHRGSAFGNLLLPPQPSQADFETELQNISRHFSKANYIFIEQKPPSIGKRKIPGWLYSKVKDGILIQLNADKEIRINNILKDYVPAGKHQLKIALHKMSEHLPSGDVSKLEDYLEEENYKMFFERMIGYYDSTSNYQLHDKASINLEIDSDDFIAISKKLLQLLHESGINFKQTQESGIVS